MVDRGAASLDYAISECSKPHVGARRVLLFDYHVERAFVDELRRWGVEVVVTVDGRCEGIPHVPLEAFRDARIVATGEDGDGLGLWQPTDTDFRAYVRGIARVGLTPFTGTLNLDFGGGIGAEQLEGEIRRHVAAGAALLIEHRVDEVWFTSVPHFGLDQALAIAARICGIPVLVTRQLPFPAKFTWQWWRRGRAYPGSALEGFERWVRGAIEPNLFYMKPRSWDYGPRGLARRVGGLARQAIRFRWREIGARLWRAMVDRRRWRIAIALEWLDPRTRAMAIRHRSDLRESIAARKRRRFVSVDALDRPFVYFPLHYEPEANADVFGGAYAFQPDAIAALAACIPKDWIVLLKESPAQGILRRGEAFHGLIESLPNVRWVPDDTSSAMLVERAALVASLCGTVGYEALLIGKPCLYFGDPWYAGLPGAVRFDPGLDLEALARVEVKKGALDAAVNALVSAAADGIAMRRFTALLPEVGESEATARVTARSLARISLEARGSFQ